MQAATRHGLALGTSVLLHGGLLAYALVQIVPEFDLPEIELEFTEVEVIDAEALRADEPVEVEAPPVNLPAPPPPDQAPEEGEGEEEEQPEAEEETEEEAEPDRRLGKRKSKVDELAPPTARWHILVVPKKIRQLPFRETVVDVMAPFPDFVFLVEGGGFDPMRDFDHIVIASPDLRDMTQTFLAVDYKMDRQEVKRAIERAAAADDQTIDWVEQGGIIRGNPKPRDGSKDKDPRSFVLLKDKVAVFVRDEFVDAIVENEGGDAKTLGNFVANLTNLKRFAARIPAAGLQLTWKDIHAALKSVRGLPFPLPDDFELTAEASEDPEVLVRLEFLTAVDAKVFEKYYRETLPQEIGKSMMLRYSVKSIYEATEVERSGRELKLWTELTTPQLETLLQVIAQLNAKHQRIDEEQMKERRRLREERWEQREGGNLPPSALGEITPEDSDAPALPPPSDAAPPAGFRRGEL